MQSIDEGIGDDSRVVGCPCTLAGLSALQEMGGELSHANCDSASKIRTGQITCNIARGKCKLYYK